MDDSVAPEESRTYRERVPREMAPGPPASPGSLVFEALADPTRRAILRFLADRDEAPVGDIVAGVATVTRTAISNHLRFLRAAELVRERRHGRYRLYSIERQAVDGLVAFLAGLYRSPLADLKHRFENQETIEGSELGGSARIR